MANTNKLFTIFQNLDKAVSGNWLQDQSAPRVNSYDISKTADRDILYRTDNKIDYAKTKLEMQQNKWLSNRWKKANIDLSVQAFSGLNNVKLMYRDADLMDAFPEIGAALDIVAEESSIVGDNGQIINVYSQSNRVKSVLEDLFVNRLDIQVMAPMIIRAMCKYGNQFMLLNIDNKRGILGWKQLPVFNVERLENGIENQYGARITNADDANADLTTKFIWADENNSQVAFRNWQIGHFRLLTDSIYLPYGASYLNKARRHWRLLSLMEDMMMIYRLERSVERRVYKIFVGAIDDADVKAYVEDIANEFKRTPIIDPMTGQIDLRKNILPVWKNTPIPLLDGRTITIEELAKEFVDGKENYVYSIQDKTHQIVPGKVVWCGKNYTCPSMVKITLDDDTYCMMAPEHEVIMRDGSKRRADELRSGESIMPFKDKKEIIGSCEVKSIEWVGSDDVYCMTVVGLNGEEDRHNFAIRTFNQDNSINENGCFVSNCADQDIFIPVRSENAPTPIDTLPAAQNLTAIDDIKFIQNKVLTALRIPKAFLNFEETVGEGQNLALMDIRFTRTINRIQQSFLMELNKIAQIHLYILGFEDELTNFSLSMNNPSTQAETLQVENLQKKISAMRDAVSDPGTGIPLMSQTRALKEIMKWSEKDIQTNLEEIRLEKALSAELEKTTQIIKRTGIFDTVDRMYGESGAEYQDGQEGGGGDDGMGGGPDMGGGGMTPMGDDLGGAIDGLGEDGMEDGDIMGNETEVPITDNEGDESEPQMESIFNRNKPLLTEKKSDQLFLERFANRHQTFNERVAIYDKTLLINEEFNKMIDSLSKSVKEKDKKQEI